MNHKPTENPYETDELTGEINHPVVVQKYLFLWGLAEIVWIISLALSSRYKFFIFLEEGKEGIVWLLSQCAGFVFGFAICYFSIRLFKLMFQKKTQSQTDFLSTVSRETAESNRFMLILAASAAGVINVIIGFGVHSYFWQK